MADVATLVIRTVTSEVQRATTDLQRLQQQAGQTEQSTTRFTTSMGGSIRQLAVMATGIGSVTAAVTTLGLVYKRAVGEAAQFEVQHATIQAVLRATGSASGKTAEQIEQLADSIGSTTLATSRFGHRGCKATADVPVGRGRDVRPDVTRGAGPGGGRFRFGTERGGPARQGARGPGAGAQRAAPGRDHFHAEPA